MVLPNFICVGAQKAGTTSLHNILSGHPQIFLSNPKEAHFFDIEERYQRGLSWYSENFFCAWQGQELVGDITPDYMFFPKVTKRIARDLGTDVNIIFILRHPVDRAFSHYQMSLYRGYEDLSFLEAISLERERLRSGEFSQNHHSYLSRGFYSGQIVRFLEVFPRDRVITLIFEKLFGKEYETEMGRLLELIGARPFGLKTFSKKNRASQPRSTAIRDILYTTNPIRQIAKRMIPFEGIRLMIRRSVDGLNKQELKMELDLETRNHLFRKYFEDEVAKIEFIIGQSLDCWRNL